MDKLVITTEDNNQIEFYVLEQTTVGGTDYFLVTEEAEGDSDALILKDLSKKDDEELESVAKIFESILDDVDFTKE